MTGSFDQSSELGVKWSMRFSTPASRAPSLRSSKPRITSIRQPILSTIEAIRLIQSLYLAEPYQGYVTHVWFAQSAAPSIPLPYGRIMGHLTFPSEAAFGGLVRAVLRVGR